VSTDPRSETLNTPELLALLKRIPSYTRLLYSLYRSPDVPRRQKLLLTAGLGYLVSPVDVIPGFIPVAGQLDDIIVALTILQSVVKSSPAAPVADALQSSGLTAAQIDQDLDAAKTAAVVIARKTGRAVARTGRAAGSFLVKAAKGFAEIVRQMRRD
jgi:uncharacterized membrane protein YkvA (DUF1232 family)